MVSYGYDANGDRTELKLDNVLKASYEYDDASRLTKITDGSDAIVNYAYDSTNKVTLKQLPNGVHSTYLYDDINRLTRITDATASATVADFQYQYDAASQISQQIDPAGTHSYGYDVVNRLTSATHNAQPAENYVYDGVGNRTSSSPSTSYAYAPFNRLTSTDSVTLTYDNNGNSLSKTPSSGPALEFEWDFENRLVGATPSGASPVTYSYDALGRRVKRTVGSSWTKFTYDEQNVILDHRSDMSTVEYLNGPGTDSKVRQTDSATSETLYFTQDHLGSTRALTNPTGNIVESISYDSFGNGAVSGHTRFLYTGRELDLTTSLYNYRSRYYDPALGRFLSEDSIRLRGGNNLYAYVGNNPGRFVDPFGTEAVTASILGAGAAAGAGVGAGTVAAAGAVVVAYGAVLYGAWELGEWVADQPWNPLTHPATPPIGNLCPIRPLPIPVPVSSTSPPVIDPAIKSWKKTRADTLKGNPNCAWCGLPAERNGRPGHGDHIVPRSKGGGDEPDNVQPACEHCNTSRGNRDFPPTSPKDYEGPWPRPGWPKP